MLKKEEVLSVANLARLKLTSDEQAKFTEQLENVLDLFEKIKKLDLSNVAETSQVTGLKNICEADEVIEDPGSRPKDKEELLQNAPKHDQDSIIVPKVIQD